MGNLSKIPDPESVTKFVLALDQHSKVTSVMLESPTLLTVKLAVGNLLQVETSNIYCVGEADVREILAENPTLNSIVTLSAWNMVTNDAAQYGRERQKGVFTWKQFFGAINYRKFWLYEEMPTGLKPPEIAQERKRRDRAWN